MANKMNFGVGINLYADKFRKGAKQVNGYLKGMKTQVIALGAAFGIGGFALGNFFSKAFETVRSLNKAQTTLKNVTKTTTEYNKAMNFLNENAKKYNKDIIDLTNNYSKFVAASQGTGMALKDVQSTFEALTQASTYYNLSQDETNGVMLALSQMMSKGKIQAEELRGQLGERLPGALGVMARALGVTQKELDKLMQDGKLISSEVLPKFGEQLKLETAGFDKNSIEGSLQELKRMWTDIWKDPKMQEAFKGLIHSLTNALQWTANNIKNIFQFAIAGMVAYANAMFGKMLAKFEAHRKILVARYDVIDSNVLGKHIQSPSTFGMPTADVKRLNEIRGVLNRIADTELLNVEQKYAMISKYSERWKFQSEAAVNVSKRWADQIQHTYNRYEILNAEAGGTIETLVAQQRALDVNTQKTNLLGRAGQWATIQFKKLGQTMKAALASNWVTLLIMALVWLGQKLFDTIKKAKELKNLLKTLTTNSDNAIKNAKGESTTLTAVEKMLEKYKETNITIKERNRLLKDMLKLLNLEEIKGESREETEKRINQRLKERQALILKEARIEAMKQELVKAHQEEMEARDKVQKRAGGDKSQGNIKDLNKEWKAKNQHRLNLEKKYGAEVEMDMLERVKREEAAIMDSRFKTISELNNKLSKGTINQKEYNTEVNKANKNAAIDLSGLDADYLSEASEAFIEKWKNVKIDEYVESAFDKIEKEFIKSWDELDNQLSNGAINEKEYQEAVYQLAQETRKRIGSLGKLSKSEQSLFDFLGTIQNVEAKESDKFNEAKEEFRKKIIENTSKYANSAITLNQYNDAMFELYGSVIDQIAAMDNLTEEQKKYLEKIKEEQKGFVNAQKEKYEKKDDVTPNYKLSKQEIIIRDLEIEIKEKIKIHDDLVDLFNEGATELEEAINEALGNIDSLEDALKLQQVKADIKDLKNQLKQGAWDSFKNLAQSSDRLVSSWQSLKEIMNDEDSTQWEKLITTFNTLIQTIDTLVGLFQMIQNVVEISNKLMQANAAETVATKAAETTAVAANTAATGVETAAKIALAKANEYVAVTGAAASVASIPIVGAGLAAAAATSTKSLLQSLQAFEKGGIVGGNSFTGDNVLARVNSGEMILNKGQQSTLFSMLNGSAITGGSGKVDFRISGSDLVGTLNNYGKKKSRV